MARPRRGFGKSKLEAPTRERNEFMVTREQAADVFDRVRKLSSADEVEVLFSGGSFALTRFANSVIHQNVSEENISVSVRTLFDGRTARATTNRLEDDDLRRVVQACESLAKVQHRDPDLLPMPDANEALASACGLRPTGTVLSRHFAETASITPAWRAYQAEKIVGVAKRNKLTTAGICSSAESFEGIFNSRGVSDWHLQTLAEVSITMLGEDSSGWQKLNSPDAAQLDAERLGEVAAQKARQSAHPQEMAPGKYTVILEPSAVLDIVGFMFWDFSGTALLEQRSFLTGRMGAKLFGDNITIWDDVAHPLQAGAPFDGEGMRRARIPLVENGFIRSVVYSRATAAQMLRSELSAKVGPVAATGHGFPLPNEMGEMPLNIAFAPPDDPPTVEQMIASTERGLLVTRLWYIREVEPFEKMLTGMTRDGTFLVENGRIKCGVRNFRFNESLIHMLSNVEQMGQPVRSCGEESFDMVAPAMKVRDFNFTEVTRF